MMFKIEYFIVANYEYKFIWKEWVELGTFISINKAIEKINKEMNRWQLGYLKLVAVGLDKIDIYKLENCSVYYFRFISIPSPWHVGLNDES